MSKTNLSQLGREVPVGDIERELGAFFAADEEGITRASLLNFAIYTEAGTDSGIKNAEIIRKLTEENACRSMLIISDPAGKRGVRSWIDAHCNLTPGGKKAVCTEQLAFLLTGGDAALVNNTVFAHLDSDLPLVFWWQGELSDVFGDRLYSRIGRFLFDSRDWSNPAAQFTRVVEASEDESANFVPHDLSYTRGTPVRRAIVSAFNDPRLRREAAALSDVAITHAPGQRMAGLWLAAWIADRLNAELNESSSESSRFIFDRFRNTSAGASRLEISLEEGQESIQDAAITSAILSTESGMSVSVTRATTAGFWKVGIEIPGCENVEELFPARQRSEAALVAEVLQRAGTNRSMCTVLPVLRSMLVQ